MFIWHHKVHEWQGESLIYLQLSFAPIYRRKEISESLNCFMRDRNIDSYCKYEVYGGHDLLLRLWLPRDCAPTKLSEVLRESLRTHGCINALPFYVEQSYHHWGWAGAATAEPSSADIRSMTPEVIERVYSETYPKELIKQLENKHLLRIYKPSGGIKFFVMITPPGMGESLTERRALHIFRSLRDIMISESHIAQPSIYTGSGFAWIILKGKIMQVRHYRFLDHFVQRINEVGVSDFYIKTHTCLVTGSPKPYSLEVERMRPEVVDFGETDPIAYIDRDEDPRFEIKGAFKLDINRYLRSKGHEFMRENHIALEGVLKAISGFLNAEGGTILVGVLEKHKYADLLEQTENPLKRFPVTTDRIVCGINWEYKKGKGWDAYLLELTNMIRKRIGKNASIITTFTKISYHDLDICLIRVPRGDKWYYIDKNKFYVRDAVSTIPLEGDDRDDYQAGHPR